MSLEFPTSPCFIITKITLVLLKNILIMNFQMLLINIKILSSKDEKYFWMFTSLELHKIPLKQVDNIITTHTSAAAPLPPKLQQDNKAASCS